MPAETESLASATNSLGEPLPRLARMFAALSATNKAILQAKTGAELYQQVCEAALCGGNFLTAAILFRELGTDLLKVAAGAGTGIDRLCAASISISETSTHGRSLAATTFRTGERCFSNNVLNDARCASWHDDALKVGINATPSGFVRGI